MNFLELPAIDNDSNGADIKTVRVLVEIPKGSRLKYEYNPGGYMTIVRDLNWRYPYPYNYGCVCGTLGGDNDPLDVIIIYNKKIQSGTVLNCKIIGVITTIDNGEEDDKLLAIPYFSNPKKVKINFKKIIHYLNNYKYPNQKGTYIKQLYGPKEAIKILKEAIIAFENKER